MDISLIICTYNRANILKDALSSLDHVYMPEETNIELLVVNNASTDNTSTVIDEYMMNNKVFSVKSLFEPQIGKTYASNKAIKNANGEILAFIDDDHIISEGYLNAVCKGVKENPNYNIFCGRILPNWDGTEPEWLHDNTVYPIRPFPIPNFDLGNLIVEVRPEEGMFIPGAGNLFVRRYVFQRTGLFSEQLGPRGHNLSGGEDIEFIKRALRNGERLLYIPEVLQYHQVDRSKFTLPYLLKKAYLRSMASYQFSESNVSQVPAYFFRQVFGRLLKALFATNQNARRYYMVRLAATLGEIQGRREILKREKTYA